VNAENHRRQKGNKKTTEEKAKKIKNEQSIYSMQQYIDDMISSRPHKKGMPLQRKDTENSRPPIAGDDSRAVVHALRKEVEKIFPVVNVVVKDNSGIIVPKKFIADAVCIDYPYRDKNGQGSKNRPNVFFKKKVFYFIHIEVGTAHSMRENKKCGKYYFPFASH